MKNHRTITRFSGYRVIPEQFTRETTHALYPDDFLTLCGITPKIRVSKKRGSFIWERTGAHVTCRKCLAQLNRER